MLNVVMLSVIMLSVVMLSAMVPILFVECLPEKMSLPRALYLM
jgi:hypothetical protein